jgi:hypothetical protein
VAAFLAFVPPEVRGGATCPSTDEVASRLAPLLPQAAPLGNDRADVVVLDATRERATVRLLDSDGRVAHERVVDGKLSCSERATQAAVLVATWEAQLHAEVAFPPMPEGSSSLPSSTEHQAIAVPDATPVATLGTRLAEPPARRIDLRLGGELFVAAPPDAGLAPAGSVEALWSTDSRWHARVAVLATGSHTVTLPPGKVTWRRGALAAGAVFDLTRGSLRLAARGDFLVAAILARGSGFALDENATSLQMGADVGLRLALRLAPRVDAWADVGFAAFPGAQRLSVLNVATAPQIPATEIDGGLGLSFALFP